MAAAAARRAALRARRRPAAASGRQPRPALRHRPAAAGLAAAGGGRLPNLRYPGDLEEAGILLLAPGGRPREGSGPAPSLPAEQLLPAAELGEWRRRVQEDPACFLQLCQRLGRVPDIWALQEWSNWLTPVGRAGRGGRRYDTAFYLCCLETRPPHTSQDNQEIAAFLVRAAGGAVTRRVSPRGHAGAVTAARGAAARASPASLAPGYVIRCQGR